MRTSIQYFVAAVSTLALSLAWTPAASADEQSGATLGPTTSPPPRVVFTREPDAKGSGCPDDSFEAVIGPTRDTLFIGFYKFFALVEEGMIAQTRNCAITLGIEVPEGYSFGVSEYSFTMDATISKPGTRAHFVASYGYTGQGIGDAEATTLTSSWEGSLTNVLEDRDIMYADCGVDRDLVVDINVAVVNTPDRGGSGMLNVQFVNAAVGRAARENVLEKPPIKIGFKWRGCTPSSASLLKL